MYVEYCYYAGTYGGQVPKDAYQRVINRAEAYIRYITMGHGDPYAAPDDWIRLATCAAADVLYYADLAAQDAAASGAGGPIKSESNDGYSISVALEGGDKLTAEARTAAKVHDAVVAYLLPGGWLSRTMGPAVRGCCNADADCDCDL